MKRVIASIGILVAILGLSIFGLVKVTQYCDTSLALLNEAEEAAKAQNFEEAVRIIEELENTWNKQEDTLSVFVRHHEIDGITENLFGLKSFANYSDAGEFLSQAEKTARLIQRLYFSEIPSIKNIL